MYASLRAAQEVLHEVTPGRDVLELMKEMKRAPHCSSPQPVVVLEGLDGVGKSTLCAGLAHRLGAVQLKSPPQELQGFRAYFDEQEPPLRRAFYCVANYMCALQIRAHVHARPVVVDRFWPSTAAYAAACDEMEMPRDMPLDLKDMLPCHVVWLLLELSEEERLRRIGRREVSGVRLTKEEKYLESNRRLGRRLTSIYHSLRMGGDRLQAIDASGSMEDVLERALLKVVRPPDIPAPISVNWHFTRQCNYNCGFCFHTAKSSFFLPTEIGGMEESKQCLARLKDAGMEKLNFSGGEPFLQAKQLGELVRFCKEDLRLPSVSIVSNGSKIQRAWMEKWSKYLDILAISCDSFCEETNVKIGRGKGKHLEQLERIRGWCEEFKVGFKINSVINKHNVTEDMTEAIARLRPIRWKVFQCLLIEGENMGEKDLRDARSLQISNEQFEDFLYRHRGVKALVPESNAFMVNSYLILDEHLRFLNCTGGAKWPSRSIREVSCAEALREAGFDEKMFLERGGIYAWSKDIEDLGKAKRIQQTVTKAGDVSWMALGLSGLTLGSLGALALLMAHRRR